MDRLPDAYVRVLVDLDVYMKGYVPKAQNLLTNSA